MALLRSYRLLVFFVVYVAFWAAAYGLGGFLKPDLYDVSRLTGSPSLTFEGKILDFPLTRWNKTRFLMEGHTLPLTAFRGRLAVRLDYPAADLSPGDVLRVRGYLFPPRQATHQRPFDEKGYLASFKTYACLRVWSPDGVQCCARPRRALVRRWAWEFHQRFEEYWGERLAPDEMALLCCMSVGSRGVLSAKLKDACRRAGVYHILVVSGQQVAFLVAFGLWVMQRCRLPRRWSFFFWGPAVVFYTLVVGCDPPVVRAMIMALVAMTLWLLGRDTPRLYVLVWAGFGILINEPEALFGASFQLSFGAVLAIFTIYPLIEPWGLRRPTWLAWLWQALAVSLSVYIGIGPLLVFYFHQLSLVGFVANWTIFPMASGLLMAGLLVGSLGVWQASWVPSLLIWAMRESLQMMINLIYCMARWSWSCINTAPPSVGMCVMYYLILFCILLSAYHHAQKQLYGPKNRRRL